ncbi:YheC/YheD family protein [Paenibacillus sp. OV219]|uniref:YheC/YheD family protein n=1 Tax=Paenibacillus sp. OV219 TaxID=1884377 RepID=UPI0008CC9C01|nr:YheC/YheD family protein [Paenibacillus sp. OV219]SEN46686.1 YheC/D like ATP-grasp [Paenibacillus sp. OV219]
MAIQRVKSKWAKTKVLMNSEQLRARIPVTKVWASPALEQLLQDFGMVYVKPDQGTFGLGVIRVEKQSDISYSYQHDTKIMQFTSFETLSRSLQRLIGSRRYLIQQGIQLLRYDGRRFDVRVMVQHTSQKAWETTGIIGRLSHPAKIVTNYHSGGTPMSIDQLMNPHLLPGQINSYKSWLAELGIATARQLQTTYPGLKEIGIDLAIDESFQPWILEVNTLPDPFIFRKLSDQSVFRRIHRYCVGYGRFKRHAK